MRELVVLLSCLFVLTGCYESSSDLIGSRAVAVKRFDSLVVKDGTVYFVESNGKTVTACTAATKQDVQKPCKTGHDVKFERTVFGNYIVQIKDVGNRYRYGLWIRSEPTRLAQFAACVYWLGDGVVGETTPLNPINQTKELYGDKPFFQQLARELRSVSTEPLIDRKQLLEIVSVYERTFYHIGATDDVLCINDRVRFSNQDIALDKDNRHLKDFE